MQREKEFTKERREKIRLMRSSKHQSLSLKYKKDVNDAMQLIDSQAAYPMCRKFRIERKKLKHFDDLLKIVKKYNREVDCDTITSLFTQPHLNSCDILNKTLNMYASDLTNDMDVCYDIEEGKEQIYDVEKLTMTYCRINCENKKVPLTMTVIPMMGVKKADYKFFVSTNNDNPKPDMKKYDGLFENKTNFKIYGPDDKSMIFKRNRISISFVATEACTFKVLAEFFQVDTNTLKKFDLKKKANIFEQYKNEFDYDPNKRGDGGRKDGKSMAERKKLVMFTKVSDKILKQKRVDEQIAAIKKEQRDKKMALLSRHLILKRM